jgi:phosphoribosylformylglycinamidine synthase
LRVESSRTAWTGLFTPGQRSTIPLKNQDGQFVAPDRTLEQLEAEGRVVFRYEGWNPNGSRRDIAGITNQAGNVVGLMPHPEHAVEPGFGPDTPGPARRAGLDGLTFFSSVINHLAHQT